MSDEILTKLASVSEQIRSLRNEQAKLTERIKILESERNDLRTQYNLEKSKKESNRDWNSDDFAWAEKVRRILRERFHLQEFRSKQLAAINAVLSKKDVLLLMPTGGGKSLVYQLPALVTNGLTLVISPLLSLIQDQLIGLRKLNIEAAALNSNTDKSERKRIHDYMSKGQNPAIRLLYVTPEWMAKSKIFMSNLQKCHAAKRLDRIAIDEVHCCSQWGHDFRPDYKFLGLLKSMFSGVPFIGLTATATMSILLDVQEMLDMQGCVILKAPFNRPNLYYKVIPKPAQSEDCVKYLEKLLTTKFKNQSGIIYATTIKDCEELTKSLRERGLRVKQYHANIENDARSAIHEKWQDGTYQAVIATVAFGMGIDKPDVRFVIHHSMPKSMEGLYQESGRAGRDGKRAECILMYRFADFLRHCSMVESKTEDKNLYTVLEYCLEITKCRRALIASHFDETWDSDQCNKMCDHCKHQQDTYTTDITQYRKDIYTILEQASRNEVSMTLLKLLDSWYQNGSKPLRAATVRVPKISREQAENIVAYLLIKRYLSIDKKYTAYAVNCYIQKRYDEVPEEKIEMVCKKKSSRKPGEDDCEPQAKRIKQS